MKRFKPSQKTKQIPKQAEPKNFGELYDVCSWCKWFTDGKCSNDKTFDYRDEGGIDFHKFFEDGHLAEVINEGFSYYRFPGVENVLATSRLSKKQQVQIMEALHEEFDNLKINLVEGIDESVSKALINFDFDPSETEGVYIKNPATFSCKYFW